MQISFNPSSLKLALTTIGKHIAIVKCLRCSFSNIFCATENEFVQPSCVALNSQAFAFVIRPPHRLHDCNHCDLCFMQFVICLFCNLWFVFFCNLWFVFFAICDLCFLQFLTCVFCNLRFCRLQFCDSALRIHAAFMPDCTNCDFRRRRIFTLIPNMLLVFSRFAQQRRRSVTNIIQALCILLTHFDTPPKI